MTSLWKRYGWKLWVIPSLPLLVLAWLSLSLLLMDLPLGPPLPAAQGHWLHGAFHVPAQDLQGRQRIPEMLRAAHGLGLDFVVLVSQGYELSPDEAGVRQELVVIPGVRYDMGKGHLLFFGPDAQRSPGQRPQDAAARVHEMLKASSLDMGVLVAPTSSQEGWSPRQVLPTLKKEGQPQMVEALPRLGLEILSANAQHENEYVSWHLPVIWGAWAWLFNERYAALSFYDRPDETLPLWDKLNQSRQDLVVGFCSVEARHKLGQHNELALSTFGTWVYFEEAPPEDPLERQHAVTQALRDGRFHCGVDLLAPSAGFGMRWVAPGGGRATMGDRVTWEPGARLLLQAPVIEGTKVRISVFRDGQQVALRSGHQMEVEVDKPGTWRAEVDLEAPSPGGGASWQTWIYGNPIKVLDAPQTDEP